jgi:hypothetical protein
MLHHSGASADTGSGDGKSAAGATGPASVGEDPAPPLQATRPIASPMVRARATKRFLTRLSLLLN